MKRTRINFGWLATLLVAAWVVWFLGIVFEFEYPYTLTLVRVRHAVSVSGVPISKIMEAKGTDSLHGFRWHTCSYCAYFCGKNKNLISVRLDSPDMKTLYQFAYCRDDRTLVPMTEEAAAEFPSLMPSEDRLEGVNQLNGEPGFSSVGSNELKLPAKWFRSVTNMKAWD